MKKETQRLLYGALIPLSIYLSAAFVKAEINFVNWRMADRALVLIATACFLLIYIGITYEIMMNNEKRN